MAEVWELYVAKVLQLGLTGYRVEHTGRTREHFRWLFRSEIDDGMLLGSLRPDIIITDDRERFLAVADAKYKNTKIRDGTLTGVAREDLYQISAYLSGFGEPKSRLDGFLIYPTDNEGEVSKRLTPRSSMDSRLNSLSEALVFLSGNRDCRGSRTNTQQARSQDG